jgi:hypothetical protein
VSLKLQICPGYILRFAHKLSCLTTIHTIERCWLVLETGVKFFFVVVAFCMPTMAQYNRGTVIALVTSPQQTIMATDSRNHPIHGAISDDLCKILTFGNKVAVALAGIASHQSPSRPLRNWDGYKQLGAAYARKHSSTQAFAYEWGAEMRALILRDVSDDDAAALIDAMLDWNGFRGTVLNGIFVGPDDLEGFAVRLSLIKLTNRYDLVTDYLRHPEHDCDFVCGAAGSEIIDEIKADTTTRAHAWRESMSHMAPSARAIEAVRLTINYSPRQDDIGGEIDAVLVSKNGIRWIHQKEICKCKPHNRSLKNSCTGTR